MVRPEPVEFLGCELDRQSEEGGIRLKFAAGLAVAVAVTPRPGPARPDQFPRFTPAIASR